MKWVEKYCHIPFVNDGMSFDGCHCWGLVRLIYANECGIDLPAYASTTATDTDEVTGFVSSDSAARPWQAVVSLGEERAFDVVVMRGVFESNGRRVTGPVHVGIIVAPNMMLHVQSGKNSVCVPLNHPSIKKRILSIHRHEDLI
jgi:cell wall-associated NlpC family hydrolase